MDDLKQDNNLQCRELERLAAAAASRDYTETDTNDMGHNPTITDAINMSSSTSTENSAAVSHMISYIHPYQLARSHQFVPLRTFDAQQFPQEPNGSVQLPASRLVVVPVAGHIQSHGTVSNSQPVTHYSVSEMQYQNKQVTVLTDSGQSLSREQCILHSDVNHGNMQYTLSLNPVDNYDKTVNVGPDKHNIHTASLTMSSVPLVSSSSMTISSSNTLPMTSVLSSHGSSFHIMSTTSVQSSPGSSMHTRPVSSVTTSPVASIISIPVASSLCTTSISSLSQSMPSSSTQSMSSSTMQAANENICDSPVKLLTATVKKENFQKNLIISSKRKTQKPLALREADDGDLCKRDSSEIKNVPCQQCKDRCGSVTEWSKINCEHNLPKRNGLSLELKIEIIKRISAGEKKSDMADEYSVNQSTIKSIMKKADKYLTCWKKGMFNPDSKRLKHAKREDVEQALILWYKQSIANNSPVSGTILCVKAVDFAEKLGHHDFKATHGWLDRFKKRKKIVFGRGSSKRKRDDCAALDAKVHDLQNTILPKVLNDYEPCNIFAVEHVGLFHNSLPADVISSGSKKCPGGIRSKERLSLVMCTNMTGNEKFPLLVVGRCQKLLTVRTSKTLPVHYVVNKSSWFTSEIISSWLLDMDSWFSQQNRKVVVLAPSLTIYSQPPKLKSINLIAIVAESPAPLQPLVTSAFKKYYRKHYLEEIMATFRREQTTQPSLSLFTCLQLLASSWQALSENFIVIGFQRSGLAKYGVWNIAIPADNPVLLGAQELLNNVQHTLGVANACISFDDYVYFDNELQVCNLMSDDDILAKVTSELEGSEESDIEDSMNCKVEDKALPSRTPFAQVESAFGVLRKYIQYQEGAQEMFRELSHLEHIIYKALSEGACSNSMPNVH